MWGKRKPVESEAPALPDNPIVGSSSNAPGKSAGGPGADSSPPVSVSRRLRRGSLHGDNRLASSRSNALKAPIFGLPLERAVKLTKIKEHYHLPAVVYRCIEFLDAKKAWLEEGIYRQSGSSLALSTLRKEFNSNSDYNLLKLSKPPDIHAVASLLKAYLRELPESVLTLRLHQEFMRVVDLADRGDRIHELGRLVSELPIANYTLLRALTAHLIRIVQKASTNRMTLRNIGIVFSPSLGIPVSVFSLLMVEFEYIFWVNDSGIPEPKNLFAETSSTVAGSTSALRYQPDAHLSVSVSSGLNRAHDDDTLYSAESQTAADSVSFASDAPVHPSRVVDKKRSASSLRPGGHVRPVISNQRSQEGIRGAAAAAATATVAAMPDEEWDPHMDDELLGSPGNNVGNDLSRYPGLPASTKGKQKQQQQQQRTGRSNRNSIQYNVGAPRELISQEADMTVPQIINESDDSDDSDVDSDDFSRDAIKPAAARNNSTMSNVDIRVARPVFLLKRGALTLFIESPSTGLIVDLKRKLLVSLCAHEGSEYSALTLDRVRLVTEVQTQQPTTEDSVRQYQVLDDSVSVGAAGLVDEQVIYFVIQLENGTWEEPYAADYDADAQEMDVMYS
ncbi:Rho GTPase activating protein [Coemansia sp. RSA 1933]|nr:Rho GTPase activating protein [Coemansia sp. RSA 1933]